LNVTGAQGPTIAQAVLVLHFSTKNVGDGLYSTMRVPRKAFEVVLRDIVAEIVEKKKGVKLSGVPEAEGTMEMNTGTL